MEEEKQLMRKIAKVLDEARGSNATHVRKFKELSSLRLSSPLNFFSAFSKTLIPLFDFQRRTASAERVIRFISTFSSRRDESNAADSDSFLEQFLSFLLVAATSANKTARFRVCQIISEIIMRLPDDTEVSNEVWDGVIECMKLRLMDKVAAIRTFAIRALARFANDSENVDIVELFLEALELEQNAEVRKALVLSLPPSNATAVAVIDCTLDVSESVRRAAYCVLSCKFPLQSLSIKMRTVILKRGLADRSPAVSKECLKLLKEEWLIRCCNGDPVELLKYLDVETYESVGASIMDALLVSNLVKVKDGQSIQQFFPSSNEKIEGQGTLKLMEAEVALYWRTLCRHLQKEAQEKGSDAAATMGTEAVVYAAEASDSNDLLDKILPATVSDFVKLIKEHLIAGPNYRFASRQLLLLGAMLDFSDLTNRKVASTFVHELLQMPLEHEVDENGNKVVIGDGLNLGGDAEWASAVSGFAKKVHATAGEFEEVLLAVIDELAQPCRERTADFFQWMHCLAVTGLLLENATSFRWIQGKAIEPAELLQSLLLPAAKHIDLDVQRAAVHCLGLFGLLERKPSEKLVRQLRLSFIKGPSSIRVVASKALVDLVMWHSPQEVDKAMGNDFLSQLGNDRKAYSSVNLGNASEDLNLELLDLLFAGLDTHCWASNDKYEDEESVHVRAVLGEGFAKILLLSEKYPSVSDSTQPLILSKLINLYFANETKDLERLKQCLSVFFETYPTISANHKKCLSKAFIPVMRSMWPGIDGNTGGSSYAVSTMRKRAIQASRFMLLMMQAPLCADMAEQDDESGSRDLPGRVESTVHLPDFQSGEEGLGICIAVEVASFPMKKTPAEKSYVLALCKILVLLHFRPSEQAAVKLMRRLLNCVAQSVVTEKDLIKELRQMADHLKVVDRDPDQELSQEQLNAIFTRLELEFNHDLDNSAVIPQTPVSRSTRPARLRRRVRHDEVSSDEEVSPTSVVPPPPGTVSVRSQRASKTAALSKMTVTKSVRITDVDEDDESSEVTSEENSDESDS